MSALTTWPLWLVSLPLAAAILAFVRPRWGAAVGVCTATVVLLCAAAAAHSVLETGVQRYALGGWRAPLGIEWRLDGLTALMLVVTAVVGLAISTYAVGYFPREREDGGVGHERRFFWPLWMFLLAALNALFLSKDLFNLYVTLELLGLSAVALVTLARSGQALAAAMQYLLVSLLGSLCYLMGVALLYKAYGTLDLEAYAVVSAPSVHTWVALALMYTGLLLKTALFPLHFWLPAAHSSAPAPVSALLSALVVKASFYILLRLWLEVSPAVPSAVLTTSLGVLGAAGVLWGSIQALRAARLKLLVAYSTVAQLGYFTLFFPLGSYAPTGFAAFSGLLYFVAAHACAKGAIFLAAGNVQHVEGHDRLKELGGVGQRLSLSLFAFAIAGASLMGLPPSGGFIAKWILLNAAIASGQWWWTIVLVGGGLLSAAYVFRVLAIAFTRGGEATHTGRGESLPRVMQWSALLLALVALALGLNAVPPLELLRVGAALGGPVLSGALP